MRKVAMATLLWPIRKLVKRDDGATMVEYALMLALIAVICLTAVKSVGAGAKVMFTSVSASL
jgi:pilus assembly protein Flp/PilA